MLGFSKRAQPAASDYFTFDIDAFSQLALNKQAEYQSNDPFPHIVIDNFLPEHVAEEALAQFPAIDSSVFVDRGFQHQPGKFGSVKGENVARAPAFIQHVLAMLNAYAIIHFLEQMTGIQKLLPDPHFSGGGLHQIVNGGKLDIHADFNFEEGIDLYRRINLLIYLNKDWDESYGGYLELWDKDLTRCVKKIAPVFNRCVIFNTDKNSFHGHHIPLNLPEGRTRKSLALYYYTKEPFPGQEELRKTDFRIVD